MLVKCPSCETEYDCEPGKYRCACGAKFLVEPDGDVFVSSAGRIDDPNITIAPRHAQAEREIQETNYTTMPGRRGRKADGRFEAGDVILGRYKVLSELGQGGMGVVYECFDEIAGIKVALKALPPELSHNKMEMEDIRENFQLVYNLHHPNIASYNTLERDNANGNYYLVMECVTGEDLRGWIKRMRRDGSLTLEKALPVIRQVAAALDYAHQQKIVHRDIKPGNIMIDAEGQIKVLDFGLAAQIRTSLTRVSKVTGETSGTAPYMAPEQWNGKAQGAAADQYALAVMTYEMLAGHLPFESSDMAVLQQAVLNAMPDLIEGLPAHAQGVIKRAMNKDPKQRFSTCSEFIDMLEQKASKTSVSPVFPAPKPASVAPVTPVAPAPKSAPVDPAAPAPKPTPEPKSAPVDPAASEKKPSEPVREKVPEQDRRKRAGKRGAVFGGISVVVMVAVIFLFVFSKDTEQRVQIPPGDKTIVLPGNVKLELVKVEAGSFEMSAKDGENYYDEVPHRATLKKDFYIGQTEVTQAQWKAVMGGNPSDFKGDDLPVESVSWNDAMAFCKALNSRGKAPNGWKFTLPTETQWEYAARGGRKSKGYKYSGSNSVGKVAWYNGNSVYKTHPVGQKKANELGLYDMSGNVWEWCLDDWNSDSSKQEAEFTRGNNSGGSARVIRGGGWGNYVKYWRSAYRGNRGPGHRNSYLGFRVALVPESY